MSALASGATLLIFPPVGVPLNVSKASNSVFSGNAFVRSIYIALLVLSKVYAPSLLRFNLAATP